MAHLNDSHLVCSTLDQVYRTCILQNDCSIITCLTHVVLLYMSQNEIVIYEYVKLQFLNVDIV